MARIVAFSGSNRRGSFNRQALEIAVVGAREAGAEVDLLNLADYPMPLYDADWHLANGVPAAMLALRARMLTAGGLLLASPEYNSSITPLLKNTIDWLSQSVDGASGTLPFAGKVCGLLGASPGAFGGVRALPHVAGILSNLGMLVLPIRAVPNAAKLFPADGSAQDTRTVAMLQALGAEVAHKVSQLS